MIAQVVKPFDSDEHKMKAAAVKKSPETLEDHDTSTMAKARFMISDILEQAKPAGAQDFYLPMMAAAAMAAYRPAAAASMLGEVPEEEAKEDASEGKQNMKIILYSILCSSLSNGLTTWVIMLKSYLTSSALWSLSWSSITAEADFG